MSLLKNIYLFFRAFLQKRPMFSGSLLIVATLYAPSLKHTHSQTITHSLFLARTHTHTDAAEASEQAEMCDVQLRSVTGERDQFKEACRQSQQVCTTSQTAAEFAQLDAGACVCLCAEVCVYVLSLI